MRPRRFSAPGPRHMLWADLNRFFARAPVWFLVSPGRNMFDFKGRWNTRKQQHTRGFSFSRPLILLQSDDWGA